MNISGTALWNDDQEFNIQTNDPVEQLYKKLIAQLKEKHPDIHLGYLESCGPNAMTNCLAVTLRGREIINKLTWTYGRYRQQFPHLLIGFLNDPINYDKLTRARLKSGAPYIDPDKIQGNRVPQYYTVLAELMLDISAYFGFGCSFDRVKEIVSKGNPVQLCHINPGHYFSVKAYDHQADNLIGDDSWPRDGFRGFNKKYTREDFKNIQNWLLWYDIR